MKWFRKEEPKVTEIHHFYDVVPKPPFDWENTTSEQVKAYFSTLSRLQMLELQDRTDIPDEYWEEFYQCFNEFTLWPRDEDTSEALNKLYWERPSTFTEVKELKNQVQGMQKKLDRLASLIENTEVTMSGKTALNL